MIKSISQHLAYKLGTSLHACNDGIAIYAYGLEILLDAIIQIVIILTISWSLGIFYSCIIFVSIFFLFRRLGGGVHLNSYLKCLLFDIILVILMGKISQIKVPLYVLLSLFLITIFFSCLVCLKWVPGGTDKKSITNPIDRRNHKIETFFALALWSIAVAFCSRSHFYTLSMAAILAVFWSSFFVTPAGYRFIGILNKL